MKTIHALKFFVPCNPRGKGRPRFRVIFPKADVLFDHVSGGAKAFRSFVKSNTWVGTYTDDDTKAAELKVLVRFKRVHEDWTPWPGPVKISIKTRMPIMKSWTKGKKQAALNNLIAHQSSPDTDNITKLVLDALNKVAYEDDKQVFVQTCVKEFSERPGLLIGLWMQE